MVAFGVAKYYKRYSFARLPGEGFLFCEEKEPKVTRGGPRDPLRVGTPRPETLRIPGAGLDDAYKVFILIRSQQNPK